MLAEGLLAEDGASVAIEALGAVGEVAEGCWQPDKTRVAVTPRPRVNNEARVAREIRADTRKTLHRQQISNNTNTIAGKSLQKIPEF